MNPPGRAVAGAVAAVALVAAWLAWRAATPGFREESRQTAAASSADAAAAPTSAPAETSLLRRAAALPPSLRGTEADGALVVDADGRFIPTPDAIDLFDYYLAAAGEESPDQLHARIVAAIRARLTGEAAAAAEALLDDYLAYRAEAAELFEGDADGLDLERRLQRVRELRRGIFGADVAEALFGEEEARWRVELERQRVLTDASLDAEARAERLEILDAQIPEEVRLAREAALAPRLLQQEEERLRAGGAGAAEIDALRERRFGPEAAARLAALDTERSRWDQRVAAYRTERDEQLARAAPGERDALLAEIRARHFDPVERLRIRTLDRLEGLEGAGEP